MTVKTKTLQTHLASERLESLAEQTKPTSSDKDISSHITPVDQILEHRNHCFGEAFSERHPSPISHIYSKQSPPRLLGKQLPPPSRSRARTFCSSTSQANFAPIGGVHFQRSQCRQARGQVHPTALALSAKFAVCGYFSNVLLIGYA